MGESQISFNFTVSGGVLSRGTMRPSGASGERGAAQAHTDGPIGATTFNSGCRLHGRRCTIPWGWDRDYTDSPRPYTLDELEQRQECPHFYAYPDDDAYLLGWRIWRQIRRDGRLNEAESAVRWARIERRLEELMAKQQARSSW